MTDIPRLSSSSPFGGITLTGIVLISAWIVVGVAVAAALVSAVDAERFARYAPRLLQGVVTTLELVGFSVILGALLSLPVAAGRLSENRIAGAFAYAYSYFFRGTPLLAQLFLIYYGAGQFSAQLQSAGLWWIFSSPFGCALLSFTLNTAAYQGEILAGAIRTVPRGQSEGAAALGLHRWLTLRKVILPQALISALRPYGNETILMVKASAVASIVTVLDIMGQTRLAFSRTFDLTFYLWAALFYLVIVGIISAVVKQIERAITRHLHR